MVVPLWVSDNSTRCSGYGCIPVVRETGGLADTVRDSITGFTFYDFSSVDFFNAIQRAMFVYYNDPESWQAIQRQGMLTVFRGSNQPTVINSCMSGQSLERTDFGFLISDFGFRASNYFSALDLDLALDYCSAKTSKIVQQ